MNYLSREAVERAKEAMRGRISECSQPSLLYDGLCAMLDALAEPEPAEMLANPDVSAASVHSINHHRRIAECGHFHCAPYKPAEPAEPRRMRANARCTHINTEYHNTEHDEVAACTDFTCEPVEPPDRLVECDKLREALEDALASCENGENPNARQIAMWKNALGKEARDD